MSEQLLELRNITKRFGETDVLNGITLSIEKGEFITFLGASGCGKPPRCGLLQVWSSRTAAACFWMEKRSQVYHPMKET